MEAHPSTSEHDQWQEPLTPLIQHFQVNTVTSARARVSLSYLPKFRDFILDQGKLSRAKRKFLSTAHSCCAIKYYPTRTRKNTLRMYHHPLTAPNSTKHSCLHPRSWQIWSQTEIMTTWSQVTIIFVVSLSITRHGLGITHLEYSVTLSRHLARQPSSRIVTNLISGDDQDHTNLISGNGHFTTPLSITRQGLGKNHL